MIFVPETDNRISIMKIQAKQCTHPKTGSVYFAKIFISSLSMLEELSASAGSSLSTSSSIRGTRGASNGVFSEASSGPGGPDL